MKSEKLFFSIKRRNGKIIVNTYLLIIHISFKITYMLYKTFILRPRGNEIMTKFQHVELYWNL